MTIAPLPPGRAYFFGPNGEPLSGGKVFTWIPGTTTVKNTWQDPSQAALNTDPVLLDANGSAVIYGWGAYRLQVQDSSGDVISDSVTYGGPPTQTYTIFRSGSGTWTVPAGVYQIYLEGVGGGGAGSNCLAASATGDVSGAGGGAGGFSSGIFSVTPGLVISYAVGAGAASASQANGGTTSFGVYINCIGGNGANFSSSGTSTGGLGGAAAGGNISNMTGGAGTDGSHIPPSGGQPYVGSGNGGASAYGPGGTAVNGATGHAGVAPGSGGGGAMDVNLTGASLSGGAGAAGQILISYWS